MNIMLTDHAVAPEKTDPPCLETSGTLRNDLIWRYWGKTGVAEGSAIPAWHPLVCHSLDVAAVGRVLLMQNHRLRRVWAGALGMDEQRLVEWVTFFLALHDLGKFAESFQALKATLLRLLRGIESRRGYPLRHDTLGYLLWLYWIRDVALAELGQATTSGPHPLDPWASAVTGHHGAPPVGQANGEYELQKAFADEDRLAAQEYVRALGMLLLSSDSQPFDYRKLRNTSKRFSWWLAGLTVLADWIGSSQLHFPFCPEEGSLEHYWQTAQARAAVAVDETGLSTVESAGRRSFAELFPALEGSSPSPLQQLAATVALGSGARLFILEDMTGAGKTEAAMLLVHRLLDAGSSDGFYLALPTMATANAMYHRMAGFYRHLFRHDSHPSLVLAHGASALSGTFRQSLLAKVVPGVAVLSDETDAGAHCVAWLADSRKKALLAQVGVGTIDQALLAVLRARHQSLRLLGLFGKVLVIDEVHANDAYMHSVLRSLLAFHAASGGNAILLSATLPQRMRQELVEAFVKGREGSGPDLQASAYPLLTRIADDGLAEIPVAVRSGLPRRVAVAWLESPHEVVQHIVEVVQSGRCICWVRNTVADAREGYRAVTALLPDERVELFHARFAMGDRLDIEERVMAAFGVTSGPTQRQGRVVVATQVVEQSLDLDFDEMVSDLAPIDLLIQRAGRLRRHRRSSEGACCQGADGRGTPVLFIHGPVPDDAVRADWYQAAFPGAAGVYPDHAGLWLTARLLRQKGGFVLPDEARELIEGVYAEDAHWFPSALQQSRTRNTGERYAQAAQGGFNVVQLTSGYVPEMNGWGEDDASPTRLGEPEATLRLARWDQDRLQPWCDGEMAWQMSQVKLRQFYAREEATHAWDARLQAEVVAMRDGLPDKGRWSLLVPLVPGGEGWWQGQVVNAARQPLKLYYHPRWGLLREEERG
ncbi:MAG: CRISPR-associated helicase Cas3' [Magnetococcales bacterium]|nr:CRISPR-associated helicase Cas3' [Magnetococcales bacterium]